jgi:hypothetical protein
MGRNHDKHDYALPEGKGEAEGFAFFLPIFHAYGMQDEAEVFAFIYPYFMPVACRTRQRHLHCSNLFLCQRHD